MPDDLAYLVTSDHVGSVSSLRKDGSISTCFMWIDWDGEHLLTSSPVGSRKGARWRRDPRATVSVVDHFDDWRYVIIRGRVTEIRPDVKLEFIDRMSRRYLGSTYRRRDAQREVFVITPDRIDSGRGGWAPRRR